MMVRVTLVRYANWVDWGQHIHRKKRLLLIGTRAIVPTIVLATKTNTI